MLLKFPEVLHRGMTIKMGDIICWLCNSPAVSWKVWTIHGIAVTKKGCKRAWHASTPWDIKTPQISFDLVSWIRQNHIRLHRSLQWRLRWGHELTAAAVLQSNLAILRLEDLHRPGRLHHVPIDGQVPYSLALHACTQACANWAVPHHH